MSYKTENEIKSSFEEVYCAPTPHAYFNEMQRLGYEIGEQAKPYFRAAANFLRQQLGVKEGVRVLDLGCSYGVGAAMLKYDLSFKELADFFSDQAPEDYRECVEETREWIASREPEAVLECVGADAAGEAIRFARETHLIDDGISKNLEEGNELSRKDVELLRNCHLLTSTGAIGYVGEKTLTPFLSALGKDLQLSHGPYVVVTILRMFDPKPVAHAFAESGYDFVRVPGVRLRQRHFDGKREFSETLELLHDRGVDPEGWESKGYLYADLFAAAPSKDIGDLVHCLRHIKLELDTSGQAAACR